MIGKTIHHYRILEELGRGGMGVVYKAEDTKLKRTVALKFLLPHILSSDEERSRFIHEAQAAAALHHPNICTIYEINEADDQTFISMAYLEGESLNERIERGPVDPAEAIRIALQVARGLRAAHGKGIIHRDIKSSNIIISGDGRATVMDFGLAKSVHQVHDTQHGTKMGTIAYMSPEQTRGESVDHRTDIWSLGVLLYEMVTGRRPFRGDYDEAVIYSILNEEPELVTELVPEVPEDIGFVIERAMAKNVGDRYRDTAELVEDLEVLYERARTGSSSRSVTARAGQTQKTSDTVTKNLFTPRVVVAFMVYLVVGLAIVKLTAWGVGRFVLSPHIVKIVPVALLSFIPTVWILAARNGVGSPVWSIITRLGIPANVVVSVLLLTAMFGGLDLGAATRTVTVVDEAGKAIERVIPKNEFRKSLLVYFFDNKTGDENHLWVGGATMALLQVDLFQDQFLYIPSSMDERFRQRLQKAGFTNWFEAPWSLKREVAEDAHINYLVTGSYHLEEGEWVVELSLHESRSGRLISNTVYRSENLFTLADEASVQLRRDVGLPEGHIAATRDLPVGTVFTASMPALRGYCIGIYTALFEQDWLASLGWFESAVAHDSTFAWGYFTLAQLYPAANVRDKADAAMKSAIQHSYKLPERMQFLLKVVYYGHTQDPDKQLGVLEMWIELYPGDIDARGILADLRSRRNERQLAIEQLQEILVIDPSRTEFRQAIAGLYRGMGDFDRAVENYDLYLQKHPNDAEAYQSLGAVRETQGRYDEARISYEKALVLEPDLISAMVDIGDIESKLSRDSLALQKWEEALEIAMTPQERARVYRSRRNFYSNRGQMEKSLVELKSNWAEYENYLPPAAVQGEKLEDLGFFVRAGRTQEAFEILQSVKAQLAPPWDGLLPVGYLSIYTELEDADKTEEALEGLTKFIDTYHDERYRGYANNAEGRMEEARGNYEAAIACYKRNLQLHPNSVTMHRSIGRCYRKLGQYEAAVASLERLLQIYPGNPTGNYQLALAHRALGNEAKAMECLEKALARWKNADPVYKPAADARATLAEWGS